MTQEHYSEGATDGKHEVVPLHVETRSKKGSPEVHRSPEAQPTSKPHAQVECPLVLFAHWIQESFLTPPTWLTQCREDLGS